MSREIKFRAWDKSYKIMIEQPTIVGSTDGFVIGSRLHDGIEFSFRNEYPRDCILMQFTGLLDKSGKEIFEGDIVVGVKGYNKETVSGEVEYQNMVARFCVVVDYKNDGGRLWYDFTQIQEVEVIGNIYEPPHLLKQQKSLKGGKDGGFDNQ